MWKWEKELHQLLHQSGDHAGQVIGKARGDEIAIDDHGLVDHCRAGIFEIILPRDNEKDLPDVPENLRNQLKLHFADTMDEVLPIALEKALPEIVEDIAANQPLAGVTPPQGEAPAGAQPSGQHLHVIDGRDRPVGLDRGARRRRVFLGERSKPELVENLKTLRT